MGGREVGETHKKWSQRAGGVFLSLARSRISLSSLRIFWVGMPSRHKDVFSFIF